MTALAVGAMVFSLVTLGLLLRSLNRERHACRARAEMQRVRSDLQRAEQSLSDDKRFLQSLLENVQTGIVACNSNGEITLINRATREFFGLSTNQSPTMLWTGPHAPLSTDGKQPLPKNSIPLYRALQGETIRNSEMMILSPDAKPRSLLVSAQPILAFDADKPSGAVMSMNDITNRKEAEKALARNIAELARSNADLERFAYLASHDLQEPLRMVASYVQLLARRYQGRLDSDADDFINFAVEGATRMQRLILDLLEYSRVGNREQQRVAVSSSSALQQALANLSRTLEESGTLVEVGPLPRVWADESQLMQVFQNLIGNAIKFHRAEPPRIRVSAAREGKFWRFSINDNGIGIEPQHFERIFVLFQRLHARGEYSGTGIGLAICKLIVERHGGIIWLESRLDDGSTFHFTLPEVESDALTAALGA